MFRKNKEIHPADTNLGDERGIEWLESKLPDGYTIHHSSGGYMYLYKSSSGWTARKKLLMIKTDSILTSYTTGDFWEKCLREFEKENKDEGNNGYKQPKGDRELDEQIRVAMEKRGRHVPIQRQDPRHESVMRL